MIGKAIDTMIEKFSERGILGIIAALFIGVHIISSYNMSQQLELVTERTREMQEQVIKLNTETIMRNNLLMEQILLREGLTKEDLF